MSQTIESVNDKSNNFKFNYKHNGCIIFMLLIVSWLSYFFNIEVTLGIPKLFLIVLVGYLVNIFIAEKLKSTLLALLSVVSAFVILDPLNVVILYFLGVMIFGISELKISNRKKIVLLFALAVCLTYFRSQFNFEFIQSRMWVILASIFIFRSIIYFKQKEEIKKETRVLKRFNYFFLFPNIFAPLFPIIDFKDYVHNVNAKETLDVNIDGINLVCLGVIQLLIYRVLYTYFLPSLGDVTDLKSLFTYIFINYLLVFRLMGMLNISVGVLRIFGFKLPEIFNNIFIAISVSDFFRRLNIYWKEFLLNYFYYPIYFKYRKSGMLRALGISAVITFLFNWFFHAYQWFWILGTSPIRWTDTIFWSAFSIIAVTEMLYQAKNKSTKKNELIHLLLWPLKVMLTFTFISVIWSLWTSPNVSYWFQMVKNGFSNGDQNLIFISLMLFIVYGIGLIFKKFFADGFENIFSKHRSIYFKLNLFALSILVLVTLSSSTNLVDESFKTQVEYFCKGEKSIDDNFKEAEGYYDGILEFNIGSANWDSALESEQIERTELNNLKQIKIEHDDLRSYSFKPFSRYVKGDIIFETNSFGIRDNEYSKYPGQDVTRIAFVGGSPEAGLNISNDEILENIAESKLNLLSKKSEKKFEILNFSRNGYTAPHYLKCTEINVINSRSQYAFYVVRTRDFTFAYKKLYKSVINEGKKMDTSLSDFIKDQDIEFYSPMDKRTQKEFGEQIWKWSYLQIQAICGSNKITPVLVYIPELNKSSETNSDYVSIKGFCIDNNFDFIDLSGVYEGEDILSLNKNGSVKANHPNVKGHAVIGERLYKEMLEYFNIAEDEIKILN